MMLPLGCGGDGLEVVPASGQLLLKKSNGKLVPMESARIVLIPLANAEKYQAFPAAQTGNDGKFELGTYQKADGAPEGEYKVTVRWSPRKKPKRNVLGQGNWDAGPDKLRGKYSDRKTTTLRATVTAGQNLKIIVDAP